MVTDPNKPKLNRALETKVEKQFTKIGVSLFDVDLSMVTHMEETVLPTIEVLGEPKKVPVLVAGAERWKSIRKDGYLRDPKGQLIIPLVIIKRNSIARNDNMANMNNRNVSYPALSRYSAKHKYDNFSAMSGIQRPVEHYNITMPDYVTITYECIVWTDFTEHMNTIVEALQFAADTYWGDKNGYKFKVIVDSFDNTSEVGDGAQRIIKTTFNMNVNAYLLPEKFDNKPTTNKAFTIKKVLWKVGTTDRDATKLTEIEKTESLPKGTTETLIDLIFDGGGSNTW